MSVNVYDSVRDELNPLTSAFANLPIIDVATLPSQYLVDAIYRVASDNWVFSSVELSASDMTENVTNLEAIGFATNVDGDEYTFTPATSNIRYLHNDVDYSISSLTINSVTGEMNIYNTALEPLFIGVISTGALYPFYYSEKWSVVNILLSHTDMDANTEAFTNNGFTSSTDNVHFTYIPAAKRFKYDGHQISKIIVTSTDGNMKMYDEHDEIIYNAVIVDGAYTFTSASAVTYWVGNKAKQTADQLAKIDDIRSFNSVSSLQDIFNSNPAQVVSGNNNNMMFVDDSGNKYIGVSKDGVNFHNTNQNVNITPADIEVSHQVSGSKVTDFKVNATKITMSNVVKEALKTDLDIYDVESMVTGIETDATSASKAYAIGDLLILGDILYKVKAAIAATDPLVVDTNIESITVEDLLNLRQPKLLNTPLAIDNPTANATTVEGALGLLNTKKINISEKGEPNGVAELDAQGLVPAEQLPSYVDDVIEAYYNRADEKFYETFYIDYDAVTPVGTENPSEEGWYEEDGSGGYVLTADTTVQAGKTYYEAVDVYDDEITPETGKIYIDKITNETFRWGGTMYVPIRSDLTLGETSTTAYRGDRGKIAYDTSLENSNRITKVDNIIAPTENTIISTRNYAVESLLIYNDDLYSVSLPISIGDEIVFVNRYDEVTPVGTENPHDEGWYELDGTNYILTSDTSVISGKQYYKLIKANVNNISNFDAHLTDLISSKVSFNNIANYFDETESYKAKDIVFFEHRSGTNTRIFGYEIYRFITDKAAGPWDLTKVEVISIAHLIKEHDARIEKILEDFAPVEVSPSQHAYTANITGLAPNFLIYNDQLYVVIDDIAVNDPLVIGTNIDETSLNDIFGTIFENFTLRNVVYNIENEFDPDEAYAIGDLVWCFGNLCKFTSPHTAGDPWDPTEITAVSIVDLINNATPDSFTTSQKNALIELLAEK